MRVDNKPGAVWEPRSRYNLPVQLVIPKPLGFGNGFGLARLKQFDMHPFNVGIGQVFSIR